MAEPSGVDYQDDGREALKRDYEWLEYIGDESYSLDYCEWSGTTPSAKTIDFGDNGHTASVTERQELLQITAPNSDGEKIFVRGSFPECPDAILARAQRYDEDGNGAFGFHLIPDESDFDIGKQIGQGLVNLRWPWINHHLQWNETGLSGSILMFSFVIDCVTYQVIRLTPPDTARRASLNLLRPSHQAMAERAAQRVCFSVGGGIRFGSALTKTPHGRDPGSYHVEPLEDFSILSYRSGVFGISLDMQLFINGNLQTFRQEDLPQGCSYPKHSKSGDGFKICRDVNLDCGPSLIVVTFRLRAATERPLYILPLSESLEYHLLFKDKAKQVWEQILRSSDGSESDLDMRVIGRCVEQVLCVSSFPQPLRKLENTTLIEEQPSQGSRSSTMPQMMADSPVLHYRMQERSRDGQIVEATAVQEIVLINNSITFAMDLQSTFWQLRLLVKAYISMNKAIELAEKGESFGSPVLLENSQDLSETRTLGRIHEDRLRGHIRGVVAWMAGTGIMTNIRTEVTNAVLAEDAWNKQLVGGRHVDLSNEIDDSIAMIRERLGTADGIKPLGSLACYSAIAMWFIVNNCPRDDFKSQIIDGLETLRHLTNHVDEAIDSKVCMLWWFHYECLSRLYKKFKPDDEFSDMIDLAAKWKEKAEKMLDMRSKEPPDRYSATDEISDRLCFLVDELGIAKSSNAPRGVDWASEARSRIFSRQNTVTFSPGDASDRQDIDPPWILGYGNREDFLISNINTSDLPWQLILDPVYSDPPWELTLLNHHSSLKAAVGADDFDFEQIRNSCFEFLAFDYGFISSWDRSNKAIIKSWWNVDTTCMIAATLLDSLHEDNNIHNSTYSALKAREKQKDIVVLESSIVGLKEKLCEKLAEDPTAAEISASPADFGAEGRHESQIQSLKYISSTLHQISSVLERLVDRLDPELKVESFEWLMYKPSRVCHTEAWVQCCDDVERSPKEIERQNRHSRWILSDDREILERTTTKIFEPALSLQDLEHLAILDFHLDGRNIIRASYKLTPQIIRVRITQNQVQTSSAVVKPPTARKQGKPPVRIGQPARHGYKGVVGRMNAIQRDTSTTGTEMKLSVVQPRMDTKKPTASEAHNYPAEFTFASPRGRRLADDSTALRSQETDEAQQLREILRPIFGNSLVNLDVKYRILFALRSSIAMTNAFQYKWHPQAIEVFKNYFTPESSFQDKRSNNMWTTSITIRHWKVKDRPLFKVQDGTNPSVEPRISGKFPPLSETGEKKSHRTPWELEKEVEEVEERSSSLVITGDYQGFSWVCSIWSALLDKDSLTTHNSDALTKTLNVFAHQPSTSRCLVFIILLGTLCKNLATDYQEILDRIDHITFFERKVILDGIKWSKSKEAGQQLRAMLWGLEALHNIDEGLCISMRHIEQTKEAMTQKMEEGARFRDQSLDEEYFRITNLFTSQYNCIIDVRTKLARRIEQLTRLREATTAVAILQHNSLALHDSKVTKAESNNVRVLMLVAIAYLPLIFVTSLFTAGHGLIPDTAGVPTFVWVQFAFLISTFCLAFILSSIVKMLNLSWKGIKNFVG